MSKTDRDLLHKWGAIVNNGGFPPWLIRHVAVLLENQHSYNLILSSAEPSDDYGGNYEAWKRLSVPTIIHMLRGEFLGHNWVSFQAMRAVDSSVSYLDLFGKRQNIPLTVKTRRLKANFDYQWDQKQCPIALDYEAELTLLYAHEIGQELNREIINDIRRVTAGSGWNRRFGKRRNLRALIEEVNDGIAERTNGHDATWIICGPNVSEDLACFKSFVSYKANGALGMVGAQSVVKAGVLDGRWDVYEDALMPDHELVLGYKDKRNNEAAGYIFAPYIPLGYSPGSYNLSTGDHHPAGTIFRYMKRLVAGAGEYYCSIFLED